MANLYYREDLSGSAFEIGAVLEIDGDEARHALRVSRLRVGERILIGNGAGAIGGGEVTSAAKDRFAVRLDEARVDPPPTRSIALVQALAKGDRDERAVEQATEFGVDRVVPWQAERSVSRWSGGSGGSGGVNSAAGSEKVAKGVAKWRRIAREASKQSLRARIPEVPEPVTLAGLCASARGGDEVLVLHPEGGQTLSAYAGGLRESAAGIHLIVGPEGGLSDGELEELTGAGAAVLRLGDTVLRTSSAGPAALAVLNVALGRW